MLADLIKVKIDILLISETKIDNSIPTSQVEIQGYTPWRYSRQEIAIIREGGGGGGYIPDKSIISTHLSTLADISVITHLHMII